MKYDLIVIGAGPGGYVAAIRAAQLGRRVALIEKDRVGGTCLNKGCIPTKALMHSAELFREIQNSSVLGIDVTGASVNFAGLHERKREVVEKLVSGVEGLIKANGIDFYAGVAKVLTPHTVSVSAAPACDAAASSAGDAAASSAGDAAAPGAGEILEAENIILATGSRPAMPPIPGLDTPGVITSDEVLLGDGLDTKSLIVIGGGVIGVEIAGLYNALGAEVTIIEAMDRILPTMDKEISQNTSMILKKRGIKIFTASRVEKIERIESGDAGLAVSFTAKDKAETAQAGNVLVCIGRRPNTEDLFDEGLLASPAAGGSAGVGASAAGGGAVPGASAAGGGIRLEKGFVVTDDSGRTGIESIYAIGDIVWGGIQLAHAASAEGVNAVENMFDASYDGIKKRLNLVPAGIYTDPEIATVGLTEAEVKEKGIPYVVGKAMTGANGKTLIESGERGYVKLIFREDDGEAEELIGAQIVSKRATDMIGALAVAMSSGAELEDLEKVIWPHPTFSEVIGEAIEDAKDGAIHASPKRKSVNNQGKCHP